MTLNYLWALLGSLDYGLLRALLHAPAYCLLEAPAGCWTPPAGSGGVL